MIKTIYQSTAINSMNTPFLTVKQYDNYYLFSERAGKDSVAFILLDYNRNKIGLIKEFKPPIEQYLITAFGGSFDKLLLPLEIVKEEVKEEAGYTVDSKRITYYGRVFVSTQMNQFCYLYAVDITNLEQGERDLDEHESGSTVAWVSPTELYKLQDWKAQTIFDRILKGLTYDY